MKKSTGKIWRIVLISLLVIFVLIQFFRPQKNISVSVSENAIEKHYPVPDSIQKILAVACYDCHSNNTRYPWYNNIQPVAWWLNDHIKEGKRELNFDEFYAYRIRKQYGKLDGIIKLVKGGEMPLKSYTIIHTDAKLSDQEKYLIVNWAASIREQIKNSYPPDSLIKKK